MGGSGRDGPDCDDFRDFLVNEIRRSAPARQMTAFAPLRKFVGSNHAKKTECSNWREPAPRAQSAWSRWSYAMPQFVLIIGEDPDLIDFSAPACRPTWTPARSWKD